MTYNILYGTLDKARKSSYVLFRSSISTTCVPGEHLKRSHELVEANFQCNGKYSFRSNHRPLTAFSFQGKYIHSTVCKHFSFEETKPINKIDGQSNNSEKHNYLENGGIDKQGAPKVSNENKKNDLEKIEKINTTFIQPRINNRSRNQNLVWARLKREMCQNKNKRSSLENEFEKEKYNNSSNMLDKNNEFESNLKSSHSKSKSAESVQTSRSSSKNILIIDLLPDYNNDSVSLKSSQLINKTEHNKTGNCRKNIKSTPILEDSEKKSINEISVNVSGKDLEITKDNSNTVDVQKHQPKQLNVNKKSICVTGMKASDPYAGRKRVTNYNILRPPVYPRKKRYVAMPNLIIHEKNNIENELWSNLKDNNLKRRPKSSFLMSSMLRPEESKIKLKYTEDENQLLKKTIGSFIVPSNYQKTNLKKCIIDPKNEQINNNEQQVINTLLQNKPFNFLNSNGFFSQWNAKHDIIKDKIQLKKKISFSNSKKKELTMGLKSEIRSWKMCHKLKQIALESTSQLYKSIINSRKLGILSKNKMYLPKKRKEKNKCTVILIPLKLQSAINKRFHKTVPTKIVNNEENHGKSHSSKLDPVAIMMNKYKKKRMKNRNIYTYNDIIKRKDTMEWFTEKSFIDLSNHVISMRNDQTKINSESKIESSDKRVKLKDECLKNVEEKQFNILPQNTMKTSIQNKEYMVRYIHHMNADGKGEPLNSMEINTYPSGYLKRPEFIIKLIPLSDNEHSILKNDSLEKKNHDSPIYKECMLTNIGRVDPNKGSRNEFNEVNSDVVKSIATEISDDGGISGTSEAKNKSMEIDKTGKVDNQLKHKVEKETEMYKDIIKKLEVEIEAIKKNKLKEFKPIENKQEAMYMSQYQRKNPTVLKNHFCNSPLDEEHCILFEIDKDVLKTKGNIPLGNNSLTEKATKVIKVCSSEHNENGKKTSIKLLLEKNNIESIKDESNANNEIPMQKNFGNHNELLRKFPGDNDEKAKTQTFSGQENDDVLLWKFSRSAKKDQSIKLKEEHQKNIKNVPQQTTVFNKQQQPQISISNQEMQHNNINNFIENKLQPETPNPFKQNEAILTKSSNKFQQSYPESLTPLATKEHVQNIADSINPASNLKTISATIQHQMKSIKTIPTMQINNAEEQTQNSILNRNPVTQLIHSDFPMKKQHNLLGNSTDVIYTNNNYLRKELNFSNGQHHKQKNSIFDSSKESKKTVSSSIPNHYIKDTSHGEIHKLKFPIGQKHTFQQHLNCNQGDSQSPHNPNESSHNTFAQPSCKENMPLKDHKIPKILKNKVLKEEQKSTQRQSLFYNNENLNIKNTLTGIHVIQQNSSKPDLLKFTYGNLVKFNSKLTPIIQKRDCEKFPTRDSSLNSHVNNSLSMDLKLNINEILSNIKTFLWTIFSYLKLLNTTVKEPLKKCEISSNKNSISLDINKNKSYSSTEIKEKVELKMFGSSDKNHINVSGHSNLDINQQWINNSAGSSLKNSLSADLTKTKKILNNVNNNPEYNSKLSTLISKLQNEEFLTGSYKKLKQLLPVKEHTNISKTSNMSLIDSSKTFHKQTTPHFENVLGKKNKNGCFLSKSNEKEFENVFVNRVKQQRTFCNLNNCSENPKQKLIIKDRESCDIKEWDLTDKPSTIMIKCKGLYTDQKMPFNKVPKIKIKSKKTTFSGMPPFRQKSRAKLYVGKKQEIKKNHSKRLTSKFAEKLKLKAALNSLKNTECNSGFDENCNPESYWLNYNPQNILTKNKLVNNND